MADLLRSTNPVLKEKAFAGAIPTGETMTIHGNASPAKQSSSPLERDAEAGGDAAGRG